MIPARTLPPKALVIGLTPLLDERAVGALLDLRARGFDLAIVDVSPVPFAAAGADEAERLAHRLWRAPARGAALPVRARRRPGRRVARGRAARRRAGGGVGIPAPRPRRARLADGRRPRSPPAPSLAAYAAAVAGDDAGRSRSLGAGRASSCSAARSSSGWPSGIAWALLLLAAEYAARSPRAAATSVDAARRSSARGLLVLAELAYWSLELRGPGYEERARRRAAGSPRSACSPSCSVAARRVRRRA